VVRAEVIRKRLGKLDEYLAILQELRRYTFEEFVANPEHYGSAERFLQLAIETLTGPGQPRHCGSAAGHRRLVQRYSTFAARSGLHQCRNARKLAPHDRLPKRVGA